MTVLLTLKGPNAGRRFTLDKTCTDLGRHAASIICLESQAVSRHHARILNERETYFVEDLNSSNGTFLNGKRIAGRMPLSERDTLQIGPYVFAIRNSPTPTESDEELVIRAEVNADPSSQSVFGDNPAHKLQVILEIAQHLGRSLDVEELLDKLVEHLMKLFPHAERAMVLLCENDKLELHAQRSRRETSTETFSYSRTIVRRALDDGVGIFSEDVRTDERFVASATLSGLEMRSLLCVPLIGNDGKRLGIIQLDRSRDGKAFRNEDLQLLTACCLLMSVVLENAALHAERLREERFRQEVALAREIQQGFLSQNFPDAAQAGYELYARVLPAREVAGDLYDFFRLGDGRLAFFVGDVSGKGMPAALFMMAVRILGRHVGSAGDSPTDALQKLNAALAADNPSGMFVTLAHGIYEPKSGEVVIASAGHPLPLLRRGNGMIENVKMQTGRMLGFEGMTLGLSDTRFPLQPGDTLILYTDGFTEARAPDGEVMFGLDRFRNTLGGAGARLSLEACAEDARNAIEDFTGSSELQDDLTLFLLRRVGNGDRVTG
jgi:serine phosphatase RsbU (regulator of sigma subunit)/pSer/pThr/pTyr-binding forkhead associated (FHA) protein